METRIRGESIILRGVMKGEDGVDGHDQRRYRKEEEILNPTLLAVLREQILRSGVMLTSIQLSVE